MEKITLGNYSVKVLDPKILVFEGALKDPEALINYYETWDQWKGWYGFGAQSADEHMEGDTVVATDHFPTEKDFEAILNISENPLRDEIHKSFREISELYVNYTGTTMPNWLYEANWCLAKYTPDVDHINNDEQTMGYHTDYQQDRHGQPGNKFAITAVYYPNDDYEGGEISFRILVPGTFILDKEITYKPKKGEVVIFPSGNPYYHGVKRIWNKHKYIVRVYWTWDDPGLEEWHALRKKYGNEKFEQLESERVRRHDLLMYDPVQRPILTFDQYYDLLEKGKLPAPTDEAAINELRRKIIESNGKIYE